MPKDIWIKRNNTPKPGLNVAVIFNKKTIKGEVGIEIEVEGSHLPHEEETPTPWIYHVDGSLRGNDNGEYVLNKPIEFVKVPDALEKLWAVFRKKKSKLDDSNRTSVHVHLNCQNWHLNRLASFLGMYYTLEEVLTEWCGEFRVGNLFCLRGVDAPGTISYLKHFIKNDGEFQLHECLHYAGLNPNALKKFGSLEVRTLRGCSDPRVIQDWVSILERLYRLSEQFPDPREVCTMLSGTGSLAWFETILGDKASVVRNGVSYNDAEIDQLLKRGIRNAQDICYCRDWSLYNPIDLKPDPFKRNMKKIANKILNVDIEAESSGADVGWPNPYMGVPEVPSWASETFDEGYPDADDYPEEED